MNVSHFSHETKFLQLPPLNSSPISFFPLPPFFHSSYSFAFLQPCAISLFSLFSAEPTEREENVIRQAKFCGVLSRLGFHVFSPHWGDNDDFFSVGSREIVQHFLDIIFHSPSADWNSIVFSAFFLHSIKLSFLFVVSRILGDVTNHTFTFGLSIILTLNVHVRLWSAHRRPRSDFPSACYDKHQLWPLSHRRRV